MTKPAGSPNDLTASPPNRSPLEWTAGTLIYGPRHLERVLQAYVAHYLEERPHRGLSLAVPAGYRTPQHVRGTTQPPIQRRDVLGGLIHEYRRAA